MSPRSKSTAREAKGNALSIEIEKNSETGLDGVAYVGAEAYSSVSDLNMNRRTRMI